jgi:hypothetical protein
MAKSGEPYSRLKLAMKFSLHLPRTVKPRVNYASEIAFLAN